MDARIDQIGVDGGMSDPGPGARGRVASWLVGSPRAVLALVILLGLGVVVGGLLLWSRGAERLAVGQVMNETRAARVSFDLVDRTATESDRQLARSRAPRVYVADEQVFADLRTSLKNLPRAVAEAASLDQVTPALREQFRLTGGALAELKRLAADEEELAAYWARVDEFEAQLRMRPIVDVETYQLQQLAASQYIEVRSGRSGAMDGMTLQSSSLATQGGRGAQRSMETAAAEAEPTGELRGVLVARLRSIDRPTYRYDEAATLARQDELAKLTSERRVRFATGQVIYTRGETLTSDKLAWAQAERGAYRESLRPWQRGLLDLGAASLGLLAAVGFGAVAGTFSTLMLARPRRLLLTTSLFALMVLGATVASYFDPTLTLPAIAVAAAMLTMLISVAEDRRTALGLGILLALVCALGVHASLESACVVMCGVALIAWRLREIRQRASLVGAALWAAIAVAGANMLLGILTRPVIDPAIQQLLAESIISGVGILLVGFVVLGTLPIIERVLGVTTGLTLIELRDPSHPLLRQLQQRAPGTYNHSINVAVLAEAAAEAVGASGLLAYVGALYHDVGKMNKPDYFVENQSGGVNRHDKLTPAMSLLIIVGHVRDGIELAQQHRLPRPLHHFIEAHHGTTLVEYFYHRARRAAESGVASGGAGGVARAMPQEVEYRYPGPRPRSKEVAIVMICDASESAVRTLPEATPAKIDSVVRAIAQKRLMDGQFDECDLTLRELNLIVEAVSRTLASFHHQRITYPEAPRTGAIAMRQPEPAARV